jgi:H+/Cl- antiporter ClcA
MPKGLSPRDDRAALAEMTRDPRVIVPLIITTAVAYAVRKTLMTESSYSHAYPVDGE